MLPTVTLPAVLTGTVPAEAPLPNGAQPAENGEFEAILADTTALAVLPMATLLEITSDPEAVVAVDGNLPESGKDLPEAAEVTPTEVPAVAILTLLPLPAAVVSPAAPLQPALDTPQTPAAPPIQPQVQQPLPKLAPGKAELPAQLPVMPQVPQVPQVAASALPPVALLRDGPRQAPPPRAAATLRLLAEAAPDKVVPTALEAALGTTSPTPQPASLTFLQSPASTPATAPVTAPAAIQAPHDFAQLIDRLVAARESTQPQAATLALAHAEFGQVELRFANDGGGLSVALASADPDFARAVQAAVPPVAASSDSASTQARQQGQPGPQADSFTGQHHGQHTGRRAAEEREPRANPGPRGASDSATQSGIFA